MSALRRQVDDIDYVVERSDRTTADIVIERDGRIAVRAPQRCTDAEITEIVRSKRRWIYRNLAEWRVLNATRVQREFRNGEGFLYLGRSYRLLFIDPTEQSDALLLKNGRFLLRRDLVDTGGIAAGRASFQSYYVAQGTPRLTSRVHYFAAKVAAPVNKVAVRELGHRWASYSPAGNVAFHWKCLMAPPRIIDYLIVHELCHHHHQTHSDAFWNEVDKVMPDYREHREWLRRHGAALDL